MAPSFFPSYASHSILRDFFNIRDFLGGPPQNVKGVLNQCRQAGWFYISP